MWWFATTCVACGERLPLLQPSALCAGCMPALETAGIWVPAADIPVAAAWAYSGPVQAWIARCKDGKYSDPGPLLEPLRALCAALLDEGPCLLCAIPPERTRLRQRGLHLPDLLVDRLRTRSTPRAWLLERLDRAKVRRDHDRAPPLLRARQAHKPVPVILVDDVVTTGQTLATATEVLTAAGHPVRAAVCLADARPGVLAQVLARGGARATPTSPQPLHPRRPQPAGHEAAHGVAPANHGRVPAS